MQYPEFSAAPGLSNPHLQTIVSSVGRKALDRDDEPVVRQARTQVFDTKGVKLQVDITLTGDRVDNAPLLILIPGWMGNSNSGYVRSAARCFYAAGYHVARINLRDHGDTTALNPGLFNSAMIEEVIALVSRLRRQFGTHGAALIGYSLGGNFALRIARALPDLAVLAVCPALDPASTMFSIDRQTVYRRYFLRKWHRAWQAKQAAFPNLYDFSPAYRLTSVATLTDYFIKHHTDFLDVDAYFAAYDLTGSALRGVDVDIIAAADDPIIPIDDFRHLPNGPRLRITRSGGHGAYIENWRLDSWLDGYALALFDARLGRGYQA
ncbi:MAG: alpha/beta fold hydrolase [Pseudomonadota bacterium]